MGTAKPKAAVELTTRREQALVRRASAGDRQAYLDLFLSHLPELNRYVRRQIRYVEQISAVDHDRIEPSGVVDQVYIAGIHSLDRKPEEATFVDWVKYLAIHIIRQQLRSEQKEDVNALPLEQGIRLTDNTDTGFWEFYQPDDIYAVEDILGDGAGDPEQMLERRETAEEIDRLISALPSEEQELLRLRLYDGLRAAEIAALKHKSLETVRESLRQACQSVRKNLAEI